VEFPEWVEPTFPYTGANDAGWFFLPDVDTPVDVMIAIGGEHDDVDGEGFLLNPQPRWIASSYSEMGDVPSEFRNAKTYGKRMGIKTPKGQVLMFADDINETILKYGRLRLGSEGADEPIVLGDVFRTFAGDLIDLILSHTHPTGTGPSGVPINAADFVNLKASPIDDAAIVSDRAFTEK
jgi:hypothetical protein